MAENAVPGLYLRPQLLRQPLQAGVQPRWDPMVTSALLRWPRKLLEVQEAVILIFDCQVAQPQEGAEGVQRGPVDSAKACADPSFRPRQ